MKLTTCLITFLLILAPGFECLSYADVFDISGTPATIHGDPANSGGQSTGIASQVGTGGSGGSGDNIGLAGILFFELPDLTSTPSIELAELTVMLTGARDDANGNVPNDYSVDLYLLPAQADTTMSTPTHYGDGGYLPAGALLIQSNWWAAGVDSQVGTSKTIDVTGMVQSLYGSGGLPVDTYAVFAMYATIDLPDSLNGTYFFEESSANPDGPQLSITANVPEPGSLTLMLCLGIALGLKRKRSGLRNE